KIARDPAQLDGLRAAPAPPRHADPGATAGGVGQAAGVRDAGPGLAARLLDPPRREYAARGAALHEPISEWRVALCRRPHRSAKPGLSQIMGSADRDWSAPLP